jgi:dihydroorotase/N-acyl-D-amino-acid deacylase
LHGPRQQRRRRATGGGGEAPFDVIIANGHVIDGTGSPWYSADVGIREGRIAAIGSWPRRRRNAASTPPAKSSHRASSTCWGSRFTILVDPRLPSKIYQGITTEITGEGTRRRR